MQSFACSCAELMREKFVLAQRRSWPEGEEREEENDERGRRKKKKKNS